MANPFWLPFGETDNYGLFGTQLKADLMKQAARGAKRPGVLPGMRPGKSQTHTLTVRRHQGDPVFLYHSVSYCQMEWLLASLSSRKLIPVGTALT